MKRSSHLNRRLWQAALAAYVAACILLDLLPRYQSPEFRYTGSDPTHAVWNLGWPFALTIYDPQNGFFVGPFAYLIVPLELGLLAFAFFIALLIQWLLMQPTAGAAPRPL